LFVAPSFASIGEPFGESQAAQGAREGARSEAGAERFVKCKLGDKMLSLRSSSNLTSSSFFLVFFCFFVGGGVGEEEISEEEIREARAFVWSRASCPDFMDIPSR